jgi:peptidoglycan/LPS O-acetylase OafA/YrhL
MFWIAIIFFLWLNGTGPSIYAPDGIGLRHVLMTALLVHGFWPDTVTSVVPGGWSVADEVIFYVLFPATVPLLLKASWKSLIIVAVAAVVLGAQLSRLLDSFSYLLPHSAQGVAGIYFSLWFPRQLPCFIFGIMLFRLSVEQPSIPASVAKNCFCYRLSIRAAHSVPGRHQVRAAPRLGDDLRNRLHDVRLLIDVLA